MTRFTDGKRTVEIEMRLYVKGSGYRPDFSMDFFEAGGMKCVWTPAGIAYKVEDVQYLIDQAYDWEGYNGDFCDQEQYEADQAAGFDREVFIEEVTQC